MNYIPKLTDEETRYICSKIPKQHTIEYFQKYPKKFSRILPGFRANAISKLDVSNLLFKNRYDDFINNFIENHVILWLGQIEKSLESCMKNGDSEENALLHTLPFCFFADNIALFFKLTNKEHSKEYIAIISTAVNIVKIYDEEKEKIEKELLTMKKEKGKLEEEHKDNKEKLEKSEIKIEGFISRIDEGEIRIKKYKDLEKTILEYKTDLLELNKQLSDHKKNIQKLETGLLETKKSKGSLKDQAITDLERKHTSDSPIKLIAKEPKKPNDIDEFLEFLGYNLKDIDVPNDSEYFGLLKVHLSRILFKGIPILINRYSCPTLMKCITNTLIGQPNGITLAFSTNSRVEEVNNFLSNSGRVVCLDNFIGNYNETILLPVLEYHKDKIIFLSIAYDRTLCYISEEVLRYCQYLNLNHIPQFSPCSRLTEDPSTIDESEYEYVSSNEKNKYSKLLREILIEFGFTTSVIEHKCNAILNEDDLCSILAFEVLPFCTDVLKVKPYRISERFLKYAGDNGRCKYKNLFKGWFS
ncbi:MAG TPA: hypothetical protein PKW59_12640 [Thermotogota bacterium]|nr:hypothetical protein [Thermotogota bacterium]